MTPTDTAAAIARARDDLSESRLAGTATALVSCVDLDTLIAAAALQSLADEGQARGEYAPAPVGEPVALTFAAFREANVRRCLKWHPAGIESWSPSDWLTAITGELGELASLIKMRNRERDGLPGNKFSPTQKQIADEVADVLTYLDLFAAALGVDLGPAAVEKFNEVSERVGFPDRIPLYAAPQPAPARDTAPVALTEIVAALERESANTDTDPRWRAAAFLRDVSGWESRTLICAIDRRPSVTSTPAPASEEK